MRLRLFAAINVGSFELTCKIFHYSAKNGMKEVDCLRHRMDLGGETFVAGKISKEKMNELCQILNSFKKTMESYGVEGYKAYGTSAIRETGNRMILIDQVEQRTGIRIEVLSNSEQRFLIYKAIASKGNEYHKIVERGTAILDIGGGSIQISLLDRDTLVSTHNLRLGVLRLQEQIRHLTGNNQRYERLLDEMLCTRLSTFKRLHLKDWDIDNLIVVDDYVSYLMQKYEKEKEGTAYLSYERLNEYLMETHQKSLMDLSRKYGVTEENMELIFVSSVIVRRCMKLMGAGQIWSPGVVLCDGMGVEYGQRKGLLKLEHDFEQDIIACALHISKRYVGNKKRNGSLEKLALTIYDYTRKIHGLGKRERLLLILTTLLHDCGKYISISNVSECSYNIVLSTEIIGLSHIEREIVANVVKYCHQEFGYYEEISRNSTLDRDDYMIIAKLTAILKLAEALDGGNRQKFKNIRLTMKEGTLLIIVDTQEDITLEQGLMGENADFFEEVYSIRPVIKQKKV